MPNAVTSATRTLSLTSSSSEQSPTSRSHARDERGEQLVHAPRIPFVLFHDGRRRAQHIHAASPLIPRHGGIRRVGLGGGRAASVVWAREAFAVLDHIVGVRYGETTSWVEIEVER